MFFLKKIKFSFTVLRRALKLLFRANKEIFLLHLEVNTEHIFKNSYQVVRYRFRNALWYQFGNIRRWISI